MNVYALQKNKIIYMTSNITITRYVVTETVVAHIYNNLKAF